MRQLSLGLFVLLAAAVTPVQAEVEDGRFTSKKWGVTLVSPRNWSLSEQTSYPSILLWMSRRSPDGKILLTVEKLPRRSGPLDYARETRTVLESMGFEVRAPQLHSTTGAYWADFDDGSSYLRQAYITKGRTGITLTLSAPSSRLRNQHLRVFDASLRSIQFVAPEAGSEK